MTELVDAAASNPERAARIGAIAQLMDYAIIEGADLRLPAFVFLVRMARLELVVTEPASDSAIPRSDD